MRPVYEEVSDSESAFVSHSHLNNFEAYPGVLTGSQTGARHGALLLCRQAKQPYCSKYSNDTDPQFACGA
jgi:hypothetical protein